MEKNSDTNIFAENKDEIKEMVQLFIRCGLIEDEAIAEEKIRKAKRNKNKRGWIILSSATPYKKMTVHINLCYNKFTTTKTTGEFIWTATIILP